MQEKEIDEHAKEDCNQCPLDVFEIVEYLDAAIVATDDMG